MNSTNKNIHSKEDPMYPTINQSKFVLINDDNRFFKNSKSLFKFFANYVCDEYDVTCIKSNVTNIFLCYSIYFCLYR